MRYLKLKFNLKANVTDLLIIKKASECKRIIMKKRNPWLYVTIFKKLHIPYMNVNLVQDIYRLKGENSVII